MRKNHLLVGLFIFFTACRGDKDPVLVRIGSYKITQSEFQRKMEEVSQGYQDYVLSPSGRRQFLDVLIREKLVLAAALNSDIPRSSEYKQRVKQLERDEALRVQDGSETLLTTLWIDSLRQKGELKVSEDEVLSYIHKYPEEIEIRHVLVATPAQAELVAKKLRTGGNFAKIAKAESLDSATAMIGGKFPPLIYGEIIPELEEVVFRMRTGEIGGPLKSKFGYHIVRKDSAKQLSPDDEHARVRVARLLEKQKLDNYLQQKIQEQYPVEVVDEQYR